MATHADEGDAPPQLTARELRTRKAFVGLDVAATRALQALAPWMEAHVHEVVEEFYAHLLRFEQPRWLLTDPQRLAHVKAGRPPPLSFTASDFDLAYVASRLAIGRTHARVGVTPQWYLGAFSTFARILPQNPDALSGPAADRGGGHQGAIAVMHLDMQLAIDAYLEASQETLQQSAADLEDQVAHQTSTWRSGRGSSKRSIWSAPPPVGVGPGENLGLDPAAHRRHVEAAGAEVYLGDDEGTSFGRPATAQESFVAARARSSFGWAMASRRRLAARAPVMVNNLRQEPCSSAVSWPWPAGMRHCCVCP